MPRRVLRALFDPKSFRRSAAADRAWALAAARAANYESVSRNRLTLAAPLPSMFGCIEERQSTELGIKF